MHSIQRNVRTSCLTSELDSTVSKNARYTTKRQNFLPDLRTYLLRKQKCTGTPRNVRTSCMTSELISSVSRNARVHHETSELPCLTYELVSSVSRNARVHHETSELPA